MSLTASRLVVLAGGVLMAGAGCAPRMPLATEVRANQRAYTIGEEIVVEAVVRNLRDTPLAYQASIKDFFVYPVDQSGEMVAEGNIDIPQPDGSTDTIVSQVLPTGVLGEHFVRLAPREERVFKKEYVAKRPGTYKVVYGISSRTDTEDLPDPNWGTGTFPGQPRAEREPWLKQRKVPNAWIGSVPEKSIVFEVRDD